MNYLFLSTRGREAGKNMRMIQHRMQRTVSDINISYYCADFNGSDTDVYMIDALNQKWEYGDLEKEAGKFVNSFDRLFMCDGSFPKVPDFQCKCSKVTLLAEPYSYIFDKALEREISSKENKANTFRQVTDIIVYSDYQQKLFEKCYDFNSVNFHQMAIPYVHDLNNEKSITAYRSALEEMIPAIRGKKILSILTSGYEIQGTATSFISVNAQQLLKELPSDWVILTCSADLMKSSRFLSDFENERIFFVSKYFFPHEDLMYFTDFLICDNPYLACNFGTKKLPFYVLDYRSYGFTKYVKELYPGMVIKSFSDIPELIQKNCLTKEHKEFYNKFVPKYKKEADIDEICQFLAK